MMDFIVVWTGSCDKYDNPPLFPTTTSKKSPSSSGLFVVADFEVYGLVPLFEQFANSASSSSS